jgi:hypothetical protein
MTLEQYEEKKSKQNNSIKTGGTDMKNLSKAKKRKAEYISIVYKIVDRKAFLQLNVLAFEHHGLKAVGACGKDLLAYADELEKELEALT